MAKKKKGSRLVVFLVLCAIVAGAFYLYRKFFIPVKLKDKKYVYVFVKTNSSFDDVIGDFTELGIIEDEDNFRWLAGRMDLEENIHPGKYRIINGMNARQVINLLKYNKQEKVKLTYNSQIHDLEEFVEYTGEKLELEEEDLEDFLSDEKKLSANFGLDPYNCFALVVPGIYETGWSISAADLFDTLKKRYTSIWNSARQEKARRAGLTIPEVITLASIVQSETSIRSEQQKIAGVYLNRLKQNMPLQADPTLKFANKSYELQRVLDIDKEINSPYNTYRYKGLPPGPICLVGLQAIDATLDYEKHNYLYFCARPALNGYSDFSVTYSQHQRYAAAYRKALDKMGIIR